MNPRDGERLFPSQPESAQDDPEHLVRHGETGLRMSLCQNSKFPRQRLRVAMVRGADANAARRRRTPV